MEIAQRAGMFALHAGAPDLKSGIMWFLKY